MFPPSCSTLAVSIKPTWIVRVAIASRNVHKEAEDTRRRNLRIDDNDPEMFKQKMSQIILSVRGDSWNEIGNRQLFIYVVESFIELGTVREVANTTHSKEETISKYYLVIKNALFAEVEEGRDSFIIGGQGVTVQADESHVFKRKNNVGVLVYTEHGWLFGMVEDVPEGRLFLSMVEHRDKETLQAIIKKHVHRGTILFTDSWNSYIGLSQHGFQLFMVNHKNFVSREDGL